MGGYSGRDRDYCSGTDVLLRSGRPVDTIPAVPKPKPDPFRFARRLRTLREERGWTQEKLAQVAGITYAAVRKLEQLTGKPRTPAWDTARQLARALGVTLDELDE